MRTFFQDEFMDKKLFERIKNEVKAEQLDKTIGEIDYLNEIRSQVLQRDDADIPCWKSQSEFITKLNNARRKNLQA